MAALPSARRPGLCLVKSLHKHYKSWRPRPKAKPPTGGRPAGGMMSVLGPTCRGGTCPHVVERLGDLPQGADPHRVHELGEDVAAVQGHLLQALEGGGGLAGVLVLELAQALQLALFSSSVARASSTAQPASASSAWGFLKVFTPMMGSSPECLSIS